MLDFIWAKDDGNGGDNWSYRTCKASSQIVATNKPTTTQKETGSHTFTHSLSGLMAIFPGGPRLAGTRTSHSGCFGAKDDGCGGDNCGYKCKALVKSSPPTNQHPGFFTGWMPFLSPNQQCQSTEGNKMDLHCLCQIFCSSSSHEYTRNMTAINVQYALKNITRSTSNRPNQITSCNRSVQTTWATFQKVSFSRISHGTFWLEWSPSAMVFSTRRQMCVNVTSTPTTPLCQPRHTATKLNQWFISYSSQRLNWHIQIQ